MNTIISDYDKCKIVIDSCINKAQMESALKYLELFAKKHNILKNKIFTTALLFHYKRKLISLR